MNKKFLLFLQRLFKKMKMTVWRDQMCVHKVWPMLNSPSLHQTLHFCPGSFREYNRPCQTTAVQLLFRSIMLPVKKKKKKKRMSKVSLHYRPISSQTCCTVATAPGAALVGRKQLSSADWMAFWLTSVVHRESFLLNGVFVQCFQAPSGQAFFLEGWRLWEKIFAALLG